MINVRVFFFHVMANKENKTKQRERKRKKGEKPTATEKETVQTRKGEINARRKRKAK